MTPFDLILSNPGLQNSLHHIGYSVPNLTLFPECLKYWTFEEHSIFMGYRFQNGQIEEFIFPTSNTSLIKGVLGNSGLKFDHFCFNMQEKDYPFRLLKVTDHFYSCLWNHNVQFFYDLTNKLKVELICI